MRKWIGVLLAVSSAGCGDGVDIYVPNQEVVTADLNISGEWPLVAEEWFRAEYRMTYHSEVRPNCGPVEACLNGAVIEGTFQADGSFAVPSREAICNGPGDDVYLTVVGLVDPAYRNSDCAIMCNPYVPPNGGPLDCTNGEQFLSITSSFPNGPEPELCLSPPPPPELHTIDIVIPVPTGLENPTWSLENHCGDQSIISSPVPADADTLRITAEIECSEGYRLGGGTYNDRAAFYVVGDHVTTGIRSSSAAEIICTNEQQRPEYLPYFR